MTLVTRQQDIESLRRGGAVLARILNELAHLVRPGLRTNELEVAAREMMDRENVQPSFLNYDRFPASLCVSVNDEIVHGVPSERIVNDGDMVKIDCGVFSGGFHTDAAITVIAGAGDTGACLLRDVAQEALACGIREARVGNRVGDIGAAIQNFVRGHGLNVVRELVGHGIGRALHEEPQVPNFGKPGTGPVLRSGMVIAIEPMVVEGDWRIREGKDGFALLTKDGRRAAHVEQTVLITDGGPEVLTPWNLAL